MFKHHLYTRLQKEKCSRSINMETEVYIIKYIKQPSQICAKHVYAKKHHVDNKMQCMQINKYEHEHHGGSKKKTKLKLITISLSS
jgi:hypothetical protein